MLTGGSGTDTLDWILQETEGGTKPFEEEGGRRLTEGVREGAVLRGVVLIDREGGSLGNRGRNG